MGRALFSIIQYLIHCLKRKDEHGLHSPFLFEFYNRTVLQKTVYLSEVIEKYRSDLLNDSSKINFLELGASSLKAVKLVRVSAKAATSLSPVSHSCFLAALVDYLKPQVILELGTSFGVSTAYMASASPGTTTIQSIDGNRTVLDYARKFLNLQCKNVTLFAGEFDKVLPEATAGFTSLDLVFFDGNHSYAATVRYFQYCLQYATPGSVFVFHDIYWSPEMKKAWKEIIASSKVTLSVDLYFFGIIFFRTNQPKQHFILKF